MIKSDHNDQSDHHDQIRSQWSNQIINHPTRATNAHTWHIHTLTSPPAPAVAPSAPWTPSPGPTQPTGSDCAATQGARGPVRPRALPACGPVPPRALPARGPTPLRALPARGPAPLRALPARGATVWTCRRPPAAPALVCAALRAARSAIVRGGFAARHFPFRRASAGASTAPREMGLQLRTLGLSVEALARGRARCGRHPSRPALLQELKSPVRAGRAAAGPPRRRRRRRRPATHLGQPPSQPRASGARAGARCSGGCHAFENATAYSHNGSRPRT